MPAVPEPKVASAPIKKRKSTTVKVSLSDRGTAAAQRVTPTIQPFTQTSASIHRLRIKTPAEKANELVRSNERVQSTVELRSPRSVKRSTDEYAKTRFAAHQAFANRTETEQSAVIPAESVLPVQKQKSANPFKLSGVIQDASNVSRAILKIDGMGTQIVKVGSEVLFDNSAEVERYIVEAINQNTIQLRNLKTQKQQLVK